MIHIYKILDNKKVINMSFHRVWSMIYVQLYICYNVHVHVQMIYICTQRDDQHHITDIREPICILINYVLVEWYTSNHLFFSVSVELTFLSALVNRLYSLYTLLKYETN